MTWWYENEEEEMKLYKNEDLCIECKNEFFSKPYDHRDPTPGQLGYCIKCDNCLIKEKKMEFDKTRVYTALNADELKQGDKVIVARSLSLLKTAIENTEKHIKTLEKINNEEFAFRFVVNNTTFPLAYLVERKENCLKCKKCEVISDKSMHCDWVGTGPITSARVEKCNHYEPKTKQKAEPHYRPFRDTDELIKVWDAKIGTPNWGTDGDLTMPHIWVQDKESGARLLITAYKKSWFSTETKCGSMEALFKWCTFLDGSPCGVEE